MIFFSLLFVLRLYFVFPVLEMLVDGTTLHCLEHTLTRKLNHL